MTNLLLQTSVRSSAASGELFISVCLTSTHFFKEQTTLYLHVYSWRHVFTISAGCRLVVCTACFLRLSSPRQVLAIPTWELKSWASWSLVCQTETWQPLRLLHWQPVTDTRGGQRRWSWPRSRDKDTKTAHPAPISALSGIMWKEQVLCATWKKPVPLITHDTFKEGIMTFLPC